MTSFKMGAQQAGKIAFVGLVLGVIGGWIAKWNGMDAVTAATISGQIYWALALVLPLSLMMMVWLERQQVKIVLAESLASIVFRWELTGLGGAIAASLLFIMGAAQIPAVFGDVAAVDIVQALYLEIGWTKFFVVLVASGVTSVAIALWCHQQAKHIRSNVSR
ncbi:MAG: hypothetical protein AAF327_14425 [Cyanobacteria bacterium P01_A01_bin.37]